MKGKGWKGSERKSWEKSKRSVFLNGKVKEGKGMGKEG